ncbi:hypothetical protein ACMAZF_14900 [Psychrobium sp. nBUS_13]|uniref:hypothetical protein n=1 Tax=Psychrobium sp. nBUS_13 TaxID=3395319 RepID=UPI003EBCD136
MSAVLGGTVSKITGGKFANGAFSSAFSAALSSLKPLSKKRGRGANADTAKKIGTASDKQQAIEKNNVKEAVKIVNKLIEENSDLKPTEDSYELDSVSYDPSIMRDGEFNYLRGVSIATSRSFNKSKIIIYSEGAKRECS